MHVAAERLKHTTASVESIAREVGYSSEYAFNRAFSRHRGRRPEGTAGSPKPPKQGADKPAFV